MIGNFKVEKRGLEILKRVSDSYRRIRNTARFLLSNLEGFDPEKDLIENQDSIQGVYNAGFENISILDIANMVTKHVPAKITVTESNDPRSYRVNSDKLLAKGFTPQKSVEDAIQEICERYNQGTLKNEDRFNNLKWMQKSIFK